MNDIGFKRVLTATNTITNFPPHHKIARPHFVFYFSWIHLTMSKFSESGAAITVSKESNTRHQWASPLLRPGASCNIGDDDAHQGTKGDSLMASPVTVPYDGYYIVTFGYPRPIHCASAVGGRKKRKRPKTTENNIEKDGDTKPTVIAHLNIETSATHADDNGETTTTGTQQFSLPWREDQESTSSENPQVLEPPSLFLGKLLLLDQGSRLTVVMTMDDNHHHHHHQTGTASDTTTLQWQVRLQHEPRHHGRSSSTLPQPKKSWVCVLCKRTFHSAYRVSQHQEAAHYQQINQHQQQHQQKQQQDNATSARFLSSMWTTPLKVVYNDDFVSVVIKPQGMPVMGEMNGQTLQRSSLLLALAPPGLLTQAGPKTKFAWPADSKTNSDDKHGQQTILDTYLGKPRAVHRLDAPTGGLLVVAKTNRTDSLLRQAFQDRHCHKTYQALVYGKVEADTGECHQDLSGKSSLTHYRVLRRSRSVTSKDGWLSTMELYPHTGRHHQLRRHMQMMGHPMWGDKRYGPKTLATANDIESSNGNDVKADVWQSRLCLWAVAIRFPHPVTGREISCRMNEDPEWMQKVVAHEEAAWHQANPSSGS